MRPVLTLLLLAVLCACVPGADDRPWKARVGDLYPDLALIDHTGRRLQLSDFKGRVILLEPVGMTCKACNAFAGGQTRGGFAGIRPQQGLDSIESYLARFGGTSLGYGHVVLIQWLIYDLKDGAPGPADARAWAEHFGLDQRGDVHVVVSPRDMRSAAARARIPGFQLIDRRFVLRADSTGSRPHDDLYRGLLPMVPDLIGEPAG